jgi:hypothetical protein
LSGSSSSSSSSSSPVPPPPCLNCVSLRTQVDFLTKAYDDSQRMLGMAISSYAKVVMCSFVLYLCFFSPLVCCCCCTYQMSCVGQCFVKSSWWF